MRLRRNDNVLVIRGRDRGKTGRVQQVLPKEDKVLVDGVNSVTKHQRATGAFRRGGIIQKEVPINASSVMLICAICNEPTRIGVRFLADGTKARMCKKCQEIIE
ncbi:MAG: 50S ribosomal protein L24 [Chloroflexi bacterium]|nr:50S ribosomal protein L24 [Chloroflexota bacterium]